MWKNAGGSKAKIEIKPFGLVQATQPNFFRVWAYPGMPKK
jgi:hypothetical protein